jgi:hypothetical protein
MSKTVPLAAESIIFLAKNGKPLVGYLFYKKPNHEHCQIH